jgi:filamentous hemagglutinin family protein
MAYIGKGPAEVLSGVASKSTFTGDGSTTVFDISTDIPAGGENDIQVFVDNVRQEPGSGASYTVGVDGSGNLRRITFNVAPEASQSIYVINPRRIEAFGQVQDNSIATAKVQDLAVSTAKIAADAITEAKIADDSISEEHLDITAITGHTELSAVAAADDVLLVYDTSAGTLKKIQASNVNSAPTITSISPTSVLSGDGTGNYTFTITGTNFNASATAFLLNNSGTEVAFDTVTRNSITQITGVIAKSSLTTGEPFDVVVLNPNGQQAKLRNQVNVDASPTFVTASGSLGTFTEGDSVSVSVNATDPESAGNVTFELQSGSLPAGLSLTNTAAEGGTAIISGTATDVAANTTSNFVLRAVDAASNTSSRSFSITITHVVSSTSFTSSGTFSIPSGVTNLEAVLVIGGGGSGGGDNGGGGGAGGLIFMPDYPVSPGGTITVTVGCGGGAAAYQGNQGSDSAFGSPGDPGLSPTGSVLTAKGGGHGYTPASTGSPGGSGGGANGHFPGGGSPSGGGTATQPTQPGNSGAYGFGNNGGGSSPGTAGPNRRGGGGGGAGAAGGKGCNYSGQGGDGKAYTIADGTTPAYYAGGGGGGSCQPNTSGQGGQGGAGGGGSPGGPSGSGTDAGASATGNTGSGGGGGGNGANPGGAGGKGIVIVRY